MNISTVLINPVGLLGHVGTMTTLVGLGLEVEGPIVHPQVGLSLEFLATELASVNLLRLVNKLQEISKVTGRLPPFGWRR